MTLLDLFKLCHNFIGHMVLNDDSTRSRIRRHLLTIFFSLRRVPVPDARYDYLVEYHKPVR